MSDTDVLEALERHESYTVERVLASGPSGTTELVERGDGPDSGRPLVRKRIPAGLENRPAWEAARRASSPNLPRVTDIYELPDELDVVYEYVEGTPLRDVVEAVGPLPAARAAAIAVDVCSAAGALHACGVVHRDISPGNVIVARDGAHLTDLGIARVAAPTGAGRDTTLLGTQGFAAPEQFGFAETDARADVYSIGRLLAYMLEGGDARDGGGPRGGAAVSKGARGRPGARPPEGRSALAAVAERACSFDRGERYQSAAELSRAIGEALRADAGAGAPSRGGAPPRPGDARRADSETAPRRAPQHGSEEGRPALVTPGALRGARRRAAGWRRGLAAACVLLVGAGPAALYIALVLSNVERYASIGRLPQNLLLSLGIALGWLAAFSLEVPGALLGAGPYRGRRHPAALLLLRVALVTASVFAWILLLLVAFRE